MTSRDSFLKINISSLLARQEFMNSLARSKRFAIPVALASWCGQLGRKSSEAENRHRSEQASKTRTVPAVRCTLCWAASNSWMQRPVSIDCHSDQCIASGKDVQRVPQNDHLTDGPSVQQFDIAEDKRLLYAMLLQVLP